MMTDDATAMDMYMVTLCVTVEQEYAIIQLYRRRKWSYRKSDYVSPTLPNHIKDASVASPDQDGNSLQNEQDGNNIESDHCVNSLQNDQDRNSLHNENDRNITQKYQDGNSLLNSQDDNSLQNSHYGISVQNSQDGDNIVYQCSTGDLAQTYVKGIKMENQTDSALYHNTTPSVESYTKRTASTELDGSQSIQLPSIATINHNNEDKLIVDGQFTEPKRNPYMLTVTNKTQVEQPINFQENACDIDSPPVNRSHPGNGGTGGGMEKTSLHVSNASKDEHTIHAYSAIIDEHQKTKSSKRRRKTSKATEIGEGCAKMNRSNDSRVFIKDEVASGKDDGTSSVSNTGNTSHTSKGKHAIYCKDCKHTFKLMGTYTKHLAQDKCRHVCEFCGKVYLYGFTSHYKNHLQNHMNLRNHKCKICGVSYVYKNDFNQHMNKHTGLKPYMCEKCGKTFTANYELHHHKLRYHTKTSFQCDQCPKVFKDKGGLTYHIRYYHRANESDLNLPFECNVCGKSFIAPKLLTLHSQIHKTSKEFVCTLCGAAFKRNAGLQDHKKRHAKQYTRFCEQCGKGFYDNQQLAYHVMTHTGEKPHQCLHCEYRCAHKGNLTKHTKKHHAVLL